MLNAARWANNGPTITSHPHLDSQHYDMRSAAKGMHQGPYLSSPNLTPLTKKSAWKSCYQHARYCTVSDLSSAALHPCWRAQSLNYNGDMSKSMVGCCLPFIFHQESLQPPPQNAILYTSRGQKGWCASQADPPPPNPPHT